MSSILGLRDGLSSTGDSDGPAPLPDPELGCLERGDITEATLDGDALGSDDGCHIRELDSMALAVAEDAADGDSEAAAVTSVTAGDADGSRVEDCSVSGCPAGCRLCGCCGCFPLGDDDDDCVDDAAAIALVGSALGASVIVVGTTSPCCCCCCGCDVTIVCDGVHVGVSEGNLLD